MTAAEYQQLQSTATPDPMRQIKGAQNRASGEAFERIIISTCELYKNRRAAFIEKTPEPLKVIGILNRLKGIFKAVFTKRAQPDFKGTIAGGRAICFEAKYTEKAQINQDAVTQEQADALTLHDQLGAMCFVIVSLGMQDFYRVPWCVWRDMKNRFGHKYMNANDLEPYRLKVVGGNVLFLSGREETK